MTKITFLKPYPTSNPQRIDGVLITYPYQHQSETQRELALRSVNLIMSGSLAIHYDTQIWQENIPGFYDAFSIRMFPYVLDALKQYPDGEDIKLVYTTERPPLSPRSEWDGTKPIEGFVMEV